MMTEYAFVRCISFPLFFSSSNVLLLFSEEDEEDDEDDEEDEEDEPKEAQKPLFQFSTREGVFLPFFCAAAAAAALLEFERACGSLEKDDFFRGSNFVSLENDDGKKLPATTTDQNNFLAKSCFFFSLFVSCFFFSTSLGFDLYSTAGGGVA
jgi:hypothetical protein